MSSSPSSSSASVPTPAATEKNNGNIHLTGSQGVGIGIGGIILISLLCLLGWYLVRRSRRRKAADGEVANVPDVIGASVPIEMMATNGNAHELQTTSNTVELHSPVAVHEVDEMGESPRYEEGDGPPEERKGEKGSEGEGRGLVELEGDVAYREDPLNKEHGRGFVMTG